MKQEKIQKRKEMQERTMRIEQMNMNFLIYIYIFLKFSISKKMKEFAIKIKGYL